MEERIHLPERWPGWEITDEIGVGSYGRVYEASLRTGEHTEKAAVKIIRIPQDSAEAAVLAHELPNREDQLRYYENVVEGLLTEIHAMEALKDNPNAVQLQDFCVEHEDGSLSWTLYIRMELLTPFDDYKIDHEIDEQTVCRLGLGMCNILEECEKRAILHRDIKTENIMVSEDGRFKLGDFGLARQMKITTGSLSVKGSFTYMSPEVFHGERYDTKADQYSLGIVLYRLMNKNRDPFTDPEAGMVYYKDREDSLLRRMRGDPLPPPVDASETMAAVILKACAYAPDHRYESISALKNDLLVCAGALPEDKLIAGKAIDRKPAEEKTAAEQSAGVKKSKKPLWIGILAAILVVLIALFASGVLPGMFSGGGSSGNNAISSAKVIESGSCGDKLSWEYTEDNILTISGTGIMNNFKVLHAAPWRYLDPVQVTIEEGVTSVGSYAFWMNTGIQTLSLPDSLEYVGEGAFSQCWNLSSVTFGKNVSHMGEEVFGACVNLTTVTVDKDNPVYDSRDYCNAVIETATNTLVAGCPVTTIPDSVTAIGPRAFATCIGMTEITIPASVTAIDDTAFSDCEDELVICGVKGSAAEAFAAKAGISFREISGQ